MQPNNLAVLLELGRIAAKRGDAETLRRVVNKTLRTRSAWPLEVQQQLSAVQTAATGSECVRRLRGSRFCATCWCASSSIGTIYAIKPPPGEEAQPFTHFLRLESPTFGRCGGHRNRFQVGIGYRTLPRDVGVGLAGFTSRAPVRRPSWWQTEVRIGE